ncbi:MAG: DUF5104 domain-containing protein [Saccharofermentans sp.]|nr:DUF5104 domain-containing protein [Saccharofermentans sp.]
MTQLTAASTFFLIMSLLLLAGGVLLLVFGIIGTVKGKRYIGRIITGAILTFFGMATLILSIMFVGATAGTDPKTMAENESGAFFSLMTALKDKDAQSLEESFAKEGCSGEAPYKEDAAEFLKLIEGKVTSVDPSPTGVKFHNKNRCTSYKFIVRTDADKEYIITAAIMTSSSNEGYIGVQQIRLMENGELLYEAGTYPDF